jgi:hypothetical protein
LDLVPTSSRTTSPPENTPRVGTFRMLYFCVTRGLLVDVELDDVKLVPVLLGDRLQNGRDHLGWAAPLGPVVHENGLRGQQGLGLEGLVGHRLGCSTTAA